MFMRYLVLSLSVLFSSFSSGDEKKDLTLEALFHPEKRVSFTKSSPQIDWLPDGHTYLKKGSRGTIWKVEVASGKKTSFLDILKMRQAFTQLEGISAEQAQAICKQKYSWNSQYTALVLSYEGDLYYYDCKKNSGWRLTNDEEEEDVVSFSPNGLWISFVRENNLYVYDLESRQTKALTQDGSENTLNGILDWVYQEEIYGRGDFQGHWWSPDSSHIAYLKLDESPLPSFPIIDHIPYYPDLEETNYPKAGEKNPGVRLATVSISSGETAWCDLSPYKDQEILVVSVGWTPDSKDVVYCVQNREQNWLDLNFANRASGKSTTLIQESCSAWVSANEGPHWLPDGNFLWLSERDGWQHIYHYKKNGDLVRQVTQGNWEVRSLYGYRTKSQEIFFSAMEHSPIAEHLYRCKMDGESLVRFSTQEGSHRAKFAPHFEYYIHSFSSVQSPPQSTLCDWQGNKIYQLSKSYSLDKYRWGTVQWLQVPTRDEFTMEAMLIKPPQFDPQKKYPVLCYVYGGPQAPSVRNQWQRKRYLWHQMLAQKGYLIWLCDNRSASGKGARSAWPIHGNLGELELQDIEDGVSWLKKQSYVDSNRIGIWGWSYGGYLTSYALTHSTSFKMGISGAPVTDWRNYDTIYTERYMKKPQNNEKGYKDSSSVEAANKLSGKLLLIHGTIDDNVHLQNTLQLVYALQKAQKQFDLMLYPKSRHGVSNAQQTWHMYTLMTEFILNNL